MSMERPIINWPSGRVVVLILRWTTNIFAFFEKNEQISIEIEATYGSMAAGTFNSSSIRLGISFQLMRLNPATSKVDSIPAQVLTT